MNPRNCGVADCIMLAEISDFVKSTSFEFISTLLLFNIILPSGICLLVEHDEMKISMKHDNMIFAKNLLTQK